MELMEKILSRQAVVSVLGLGYVGLPVAVAFAEAGFRTLGVDISPERVDDVNRGISLNGNVAPDVLQEVVREERLSATRDFGVVAQADVALICVPTPLSKTKDPDISYINAAAEEIAQHSHRDMLVVLESTSFPGTTQELLQPLIERRGFVVGRDFFLAFSPERIDPGNREYTIRNTPKVVGGITDKCLEVALALYEEIVDDVIPVSSPSTAEMVKLLENTFRAVNIALVNEVAIMCDKLGLDVWEVVDAASTKPYGFMPFYPGAGLGGHCIPVDPQYLAWKLRTLDYDARFIQLAQQINFGMPAYVLGKVIDALNDDGKSLKGSRILVLGVAYKPDVSDVRESPALDLIHMSQAKGAAVAYHDPYVPHIDVDGVTVASIELDETAIRSADCVLIATAHTTYDWDWVASNSLLIVDTRNATRGLVATGPGRVVKL